ncbi:MAG: FtsQ-type POTRA domain-containing protein [Oscillatoriales cyanobacterium RM2_1_1]|nr:FtsQ-type POTRA domain-containing protein [Oscillatoriales cyanobacterium SM2_3_0]NJO45491.1 FtsQ-type POTRA domain-containing protein [Oscillatoriales cyanobacterium RM2_1_1]
MAQIDVVSSQDLGSRRQQLRRQRRVKYVQTFWQVLTVSGLLAGVIWVVHLPLWSIRRAEQIQVEGNQLLSEQRVRALLSLSYPQSIWQIRPQVLVRTLKSQGQIAEAKVVRQMLPPSLLVEIKERRPVAIAQPSKNLLNQTEAKKVGWLDEMGGWIPLESYSKLEQTQQLPTLKIVGQYQQYRAYWSKLYGALNRSPIEVQEIDWQNPTNIILRTDILSFHLGPYSDQFAEQLRAIDRLRQLPQEISIDQVDYINLYNPAIPLVQLMPEAVKPDQNSTEK